MKAIGALLTPATEVGLRKNASSCMGAFAVVLDSKQLTELVNKLIAQSRASESPADMLVQIKCLSLVANTVGNRMAPSL